MNIHKRELLCLLVTSLAAAVLGGCAADQTVATAPEQKTDKPDPPRKPRSRGDDGAPQVGQLAPAFSLKTLGGKAEVELRSFVGKRPVVLFFGSYT